METTAEFTLAPPRIEQGEARLIAGLSQQYHNTNAGIPAQWQRFAPYIGHIPGQVGTATCGVICNTDDDGNTEYVCGVQVSTISQARRE